jgi:hypothetical protein
MIKDSAAGRWRTLCQTLIEDDICTFEHTNSSAYHEVRRIHGNCSYRMCNEQCIVGHEIVVTVFIVIYLSEDTSRLCRLYVRIAIGPLRYQQQFSLLAYLFKPMLAVFLR